jgi:hypothetical protein
MRSEAASLFHLRDGKVTRIVAYWDRERALADLGLAVLRLTAEVLPGAQPLAKALCHSRQPENEPQAPDVTARWVDDDSEPTP